MNRYYTQGLKIQQLSDQINSCFYHFRFLGFNNLFLRCSFHAIQNLIIVLLIPYEFRNRILPQIQVYC